MVMKEKEEEGQNRDSSKLPVYSVYTGITKRIFLLSSFIRVSKFQFHLNIFDKLSI